MSDHTELFERILAGEVAWDDDEWQRLRTEDPEAARELDDLLALAGTLDANNASTARLEVTDDDAALVATALGHLAKPATETRNARPRWGPLAAALVAATLTAWWWSSPPSDTPVDRDFPLGVEQTLEARAPVGVVDDFHEFALRTTPTDLAHCELWVWSAAAPPDAAPLLTHTFRTSSWSPSDSQRRALPDRIRWEIRAFDASGRRLGNDAQAVAERQPR